MYLPRAPPFSRSLEEKKFALFEKSKIFFYYFSILSAFHFSSVIAKLTVILPVFIRSRAYQNLKGIILYLHKTMTLQKNIQSSGRVEVVGSSFPSWRNLKSANCKLPLHLHPPTSYRAPSLIAE